MAASYIHLAVGLEINKTLKVDEEEFLIGNVAPDITNVLKISNHKSHFYDGYSNDIKYNVFMEKYRNQLDNPYNLGYLVHLLTDHIWRDIDGPNYIKKFMDIYLSKENLPSNYQYNDLKSVFYHDFDLIDYYLFNKYNFDLNRLEEVSKNIQTEMDEIDYSKLNLLIQSFKNKELKEGNDYSILTIEAIDNFIVNGSKSILEKLKELGVK
ncbi:MAG: zinc dependent phospholipase C family protein [bacterium]